MTTQFYDKVDDCETLEYTSNSCKKQEYSEKPQHYYNIFFDFETIVSEEKHMPYLCWVYNDDIQQEFTGINQRAIDMLNALPTDKEEICLIVHNSDYGCILIL